MKRRGQLLQKRVREFFRVFLTVAAASFFFATVLVTAVFFVATPLIALLQTGRFVFPISVEYLSKMAQFIVFITSFMTICVLALEISKKKGNSES